MIWKKVQFITKKSVFSVSVGSFFNLEDVTGKKNWSNPIFIISVPFYESNKGQLDTRLSIIEKEYPFYELKAVSVNGYKEGIMVDVLVINNDAEDKNLNSNGIWRKVSVLDAKSSNYLLYKLGNEKPFIELPHDLNAMDYIPLYSFSNIYFKKNVLGYSIKSRLEGNRFYVDIYTKLSKIKSLESTQQTCHVDANNMAILSIIGNGNIGDPYASSPIQDKVDLEFYINDKIETISFIPQWNTLNNYTVVSKIPILLTNDAYTLKFKGVKNFSFNSFDFKYKGCYGDVKETYLERIDKFEINVLFIKKEV